MVDRENDAQASDLDFNPLKLATVEDIFTELEGRPLDEVMCGFRQYLQVKFSSAVFSGKYRQVGEGTTFVLHGGTPDVNGHAEYLAAKTRMVRHRELDQQVYPEKYQEPDDFGQPGASESR